MLRPLKQIAANIIWSLQGEPIPQPHAVKEYFLKKIIMKTCIRTLVVTGTYKGDMVAAMLPYCNCIVSIELNEKLFEDAQKRFVDQPTVKLYQGDSGKVIKDIIKTINTPIIFWLDGHYSAGETSKADLDTPIMEEIEHIAAHPCAKDHVLLIDDARCFDGTNDYPTEDALKTYLAKMGFTHFEKIKDTYLAASKPVL
jgi:hypothetical protein